MSIDPTQAPNLTRQNTFDAKKGYTKTRQNQGAPVIDVNMNDNSDMILHAVNEQARAQDTLATTPTSSRGFAIRPVTRDTANVREGEHPRNDDNFAITLGGLQTKFGFIDTSALSSAGLFDFNVFDNKRLLDLSANDAKDHDYGNYLFKGFITDAGASSSTSIVDENKRFLIDHHLLGFNETTVVSGESQIESPWGVVDATNTPACEVQFEEPPCRIIFLTGANAGLERVITSVTSTTKLEWAGALPGAVAFNDQYVIVPGNALVTHRGDYDASPASRSGSRGLSNVGFLNFWLHVFEDSVSGNEDTDLVDPGILHDASHRTQLRWCLRTTQVKVSESGDNGGSRTFPSNYHYANLLMSKTLDTNILANGDIIGRGAPKGAAGTLEDGRDLVQAWPSSVSDSAILRGIDSAPNAPSGLTRQHGYSQGVCGWDGFIYDFINEAMRQRLLDGETFDCIPLLLSAAPEKLLNASVLSPFWYPNLEVDNIAVTIPRLVTNKEVFNGASLSPSLIISARKKLVDIAVLSSDYEQSRTLAWMQTKREGLSSLYSDSSKGALLYEQQSSYQAPYIFETPAKHVNWLGTLMMGMLGIANAMASPDPLSGQDSDKVPPTNANFAKVFSVGGGSNNTSLAIVQSGQPVNTWVVGKEILLNPYTALQGSVYPIDVLSGNGDEFYVDDSWEAEGEFIKGPAQYKLRDGTTINPFDDKGWSFYKNTNSDYDFSALNGGKGDFEPRSWEGGYSQAHMMQESLKFRKLAIKDSFHASADLFTMDVKHSAIVSQRTATQATTIYNSGQADGFGACAVGSFQNSSKYSTVDIGGTLVPRLNAHSSYSGLSVAQDNNTNDTTNSMQGLGGASSVSPALGGGGSQAIERFAFQGPLVDGFIDSPSKININKGAWGRFPVTHNALIGGLIDNPNQMDQFNNRCTSLRLRYHIGDYYPGPVDSKGVKTNALVDTLPLFIRVEPLPLVHWATMPKHQHSIIQGTLPIQDSLERMKEFIAGSADTSAFWDSTGGTALITNKSPAKNDPRFANNQVGDIDPLNMPFHYKHQLFVNWYHPFQEHLKAPHLYQGSDTFTGGGTQTIAYRKFGERSMIVPALVGSSGTVSNRPSQPAASLHGAVPDSFEFSPGIGDINYNHGNYPDLTAGGTSDITVSIGVSGSVVIQGNDVEFPYLPVSGTPSSQSGPGPVFIPAARTHALHQGAPDGEFNVYGVGKIFKDSGGQDTWGTASEQEEFETWSEIDKDGYAADNVTFANTFEKWSVPVLRTALRSDTIKAILDMFVSNTGFNWSAANTGIVDRLATDDPGAPATDVPAMTGPDFNVDTVFVGSLGTGIAIDKSFSSASTFFQNALALGIPANVNTGLPTVTGDVRETGVVVHDLFELCVLERTAASATSPTEFLPLLNTFVALKDSGLQLKNLFNSSLRVLHARPGGGWKDTPSGALKNSAQSLSLTELFVVRDRQNNVAVPLPKPPALPEDKIFLHLESMHPAATGGGGGFTAHPNNALVGHLYPMISDNLGSSANSLGGDTLWNEGASPNTNLTAADYVLDEFTTGPGGDAYIADPFDYEYSSRNASNNGWISNVPKRDRLHQNSGIEIDLVSELRFIRENAADHGLDQAGGINGLTWLDMLPSVGELTAPGDHEIIIVLYTGGYGQKMVNNNIPDGFNPSVAGCHVKASISINRPLERLSSDDNALGSHYGEKRNVHNILGHG